MVEYTPYLYVKDGPNIIHLLGYSRGASSKEERARWEEYGDLLPFQICLN